MLTKIKFNKKLYTATALKRALADFKDLADFKMTNESGYYAVEIKNCRDHPTETIKDELGNYALQLMTG